MTVTESPPRSPWATPPAYADLDGSTPAGRLIILAVTLVATAPPRSLDRPDAKPRVTVDRHVLDQMRALLDDAYPGLISLVRDVVTGADRG